MDDSLVQLFKATKLTDKQARVYTATLQSGKATVSRIATMSGLKRTNAYLILAELEALGYAYEVIGTATKTYAAVDPNKVVSDVKTGIRDLEEMLPYLRALQRKAGKPHVQYYEGKKGAQEALKQIYRPKEARYILSFDEAQAIIPAEIERWQKAYITGRSRAGGKHLLKGKSRDNEYTKALAKGNQQVRYLTPELDFSIDIALVDGSTYLMSFEDTIYVTVINSEEIYRGLCTIYDFIWKAAKT